MGVGGTLGTRKSPVSASTGRTGAMFHEKGHFSMQNKMSSLGHVTRCRGEVREVLDNYYTTSSQKAQLPGLFSHLRKNTAFLSPDNMRSRAEFLPVLASRAAPGQSPD